MQQDMCVMLSKDWAGEQDGVAGPGHKVRSVSKTYHCSRVKGSKRE